MIRKASAMTVETRAAMRGGPGAVTLRHYFSKDEIRARTRLCAQLTLPPGAGIGLHRHDQEDEVYLVLRGSGLVDDGRTRTPIEAGDAVLTGNGESHAVLNPGPEPLELVAVILPY